MIGLMVKTCKNDHAYSKKTFDSLYLDFETMLRFSGDNFCTILLLNLEDSSGSGFWISDSGFRLLVLPL